MQSDTLEERYAIKLCLKLGKNATETYGMLQTAFEIEIFFTFKLRTYAKLNFLK